MKKLVIAFLVLALVFAGASTTALANGNGKGKLKENKFEELEDGRNANGIGTGEILGFTVNETELFVGEVLIFSVEGVIIDGPLDTLEWSIVDQNDDEYVFDTEYFLQAGNYTFTVTASTYFKNGQKDGLVHSTTAPVVVDVKVKERPDADELPVAKSLSSDWNSGKNDNNTVRVHYTITVGDQTVNHHTNFNQQDRESGYKIITKDGLTFKVEYLEPK